MGRLKHGTLPNSKQFSSSQRNSGSSRNVRISACIFALLSGCCTLDNTASARYRSSWAVRMRLIPSRLSDHSLAMVPSADYLVNKGEHDELVDKNHNTTTWYLSRIETAHSVFVASGGR